MKRKIFLPILMFFFTFAIPAHASHQSCLTAGFWVEDSIYDYFDPSKNPESKNTFDQWAERQMTEWNKTLTSSGVKDCFKIGKIVRVANGALPLVKQDGFYTYDRMYASNFPNVSDRSVDVQWGFPTDPVSIDPAYWNVSNKHYTRVLNTIDWALLHELSHARYLVDQYASNVHINRDRIDIKSPKGEPLLGNYFKAIQGDIIYLNKAQDLMGDLNSHFYGPHSAQALNLIAGQHTAEEFGNFNSPYNLGVYLSDLPRNNILKILSLDSKPLEGAGLRIFQSRGGNGLYSKVFDNIPDITLTTDREGKTSIGHNPFGGNTIDAFASNTLFILEVSYQEQLFYKFIEVSDFNLAYWNGAINEAVFEISTDIKTKDTPDIKFFAELSLATTPEVNEPVIFDANVSQKDSTPEKAEIWVSRIDGDIDCNGAFRSGNWCLVVKNEFPKSIERGKHQNLGGEWIPKTPGLYRAIVNIYSKEGVNCSGDSQRPANWLDCGEGSRFSFEVASQQSSSTVAADYFIENKSAEQINIEPILCEKVKDGESCIVTHAPYPLSGFSTNLSYKWEGTILSYKSEGAEISIVIENGKDYKIGCRIFSSQTEFLCPAKSIKGGERVSLNIRFTTNGVEEIITAPSPIPMPQTDKENPGEISRKKIKKILIDGQTIFSDGSIKESGLFSFRILKNTTRDIPISIHYSDGTFFAKIITLRHIPPGAENTGEKHVAGEQCGNIHGCFIMADSSDGSLNKLFCRNIENYTNGYQWITQKEAYDYCQGKQGIKATCKNKEGQEETYYCTGQDWTDHTGWIAYQEQQKKQERAEIIPQGSSLEQFQELQEASKDLSCSLDALPKTLNISTGKDNVAWVIRADNFTGARALWHGTNPDGQNIQPVPVEGFSNTNYLSPSFRYNQSHAGSYTRYVTIEAGDGKVCTTNTVGVTIEKGGIVENVQNITGGPKTVSKVIATIPPYGQQREVSPGGIMSFVLPDTGGIPQTLSVPITVIYSDGSTGNRVITFRYKGDTCALSGGKCANTNGQTRDGDTCNTYRSDLTGCSENKDNVYPYCYTGCSKQPSGITEPTTSTPTMTTTQPAVKDTSAPPTSIQNCTSLGYTCADSAGVTADNTKKCDLNSYRSDYTGCPQYYYCYTSCFDKPLQTTIPMETTSTTCNGTGELCADSAGNPKDSSVQCNANKFYRGDSGKDAWCQGGTPGWYCWLCQ